MVRWSGGGATRNTGRRYAARAVEAAARGKRIGERPRVWVQEEDQWRREEMAELILVGPHLETGWKGSRSRSPGPFSYGRVSGPYFLGKDYHQK
jgi:hypothetical protein